MSRSIAEQRAARRLRKKRAAGAITSSPSHNGDGEKDDCHCHDENNDDGDNKSSGYTRRQEVIQNSSSSTCSGSGDYITAFTSITEKYPHHFNSDRGNGIRKSQHDDDRMSPIFVSVLVDIVHSMQALIYIYLLLNHLHLFLL